MTMCEICKVAGYEIRDGCPSCGCVGDVGVYLDGSGCWECAPKQDRSVELGPMLDAFGRSIGRRSGLGR